MNRLASQDTGFSDIWACLNQGSQVHISSFRCFFCRKGGESCCWKVLKLTSRNPQVRRRMRQGMSQQKSARPTFWWGRAIDCESLLVFAQGFCNMSKTNLAQWVERKALNLEVRTSNPRLGTAVRYCLEKVWHEFACA